MKLQVRITFIILIFFLQNTFAQKVFNIQADFISFEDDYLFFYKKEGNMYKEMQLTSRNYYHKPNKLSLRESMIDIDELPVKKTSIKKIKKQKINRLIEKTDSQSFFYKDEEDDIYALKLSKSALYSFIEFEPIPNDGGETQVKPLDWEFYRQTHLNYCIVNINNERPLIIILGNYKNRRFLKGYLLPFKNSYKVYCNDYEMTTFEKSGIITSTKKELFQKIPLNKIEKNTYEIINNQLTDVVFNNILIPKKFDTLYIDNGLIIGKKNNQIFVYNSDLKNIAPKKLKAIYYSHYSFNTDLYQVLVKNKTKYLTSKGNLLNDLKGLDNENDKMLGCGFPDDSYNRKIEIIDGFYTLKIYNLDRRFSENTKNEFKLFPQSTYDDVSFLTYEKEVLEDFYSESTYYYDYFIVKKDNKYGVFRYTINNENKISLTSITPLIYDEIETGIPFLVKKNGLIGYYGINTVPKYKSIGVFKGAFARFVLPNNKKGWLDSNGNEYLDK